MSDFVAKEASSLIRSLSAEIDAVTSLCESLANGSNAANANLENGSRHAGLTGTDGGPGKPKEIEDLKLKRVTLVDAGLWNKLSGDEKKGLLACIQIHEAKAKKGKYHCSFRLSAKTKGTSAPKIIGIKKDKAKASLAKLKTGETSLPGPFAIVDVSQTQTASKSPATTPPKALILGQGSFFRSADYKANDLLNGIGFSDTLKQAAAYIKTLQSSFGDKVQYRITVLGGESRVKNPDSHPNPGDLARARMQTAISETQKYFSAEGISVKNGDFVMSKPDIGDTEYVREKDYEKRFDDCYTKEQYLHLTVEMAGQPVPQPAKEEYRAEYTEITLTFSYMARPGKLQKGGSSEKDDGGTRQKNNSAPCEPNFR